MKKILLILLALACVLGILVACKPAEHDPESGEKPSKYSKGLDYEVNGDYCTITGIGSCKDTEVYIPEEIGGKTVDTIGAKAFEGNTNVTKIWLPDTVKTIERRAFMNCSELTEINIPKNVSSISTQILDNCDKLTMLYYYTSNSFSDFNFANLPVKKIVYGGIKTNSLFTNNTTVEEVILLDNVTEINTNAKDWFEEDYEGFKGCTNLKKITIPDSVTHIGESAFENCTSLTEIIIPDSITTIEKRTFYACSSLAEIVLPDSVASIGDLAFSGCRSLTAIEIPESVKTIPSGTFSSCTNLISISVDDNNSIYYDEGNCLLQKSEQGITLVLGCNTSNIPNNVTEIGSYAFSGYENLKVSIPDSVTSIGENAFSYCKTLDITVGTAHRLLASDWGNSLDRDKHRLLSCENVSITITDTVESIAARTFYLWDWLTSVTISNGITSIGDFAFSGCNISTVIIPNSVTSIGKGAFSGCNLSSITISESLTSIEQSAFANCDMMTSITIPNSVTSIGRYAFANCDELTTIIIPNSVTSIGYASFINCLKLTNITFNGTMVEWKQIAKERGWNGYYREERIPATVVHCTDGDVPIG